MYRPEPLRSVSITETSSLLWTHPRILFACWISFIQLISTALLNRTFPTLIFDLFWDALTRYPQEHSISLSVYSKSRVSAFPTWGIKVGLLKILQTTSRKRFNFGLQSSLYAKASRIDRPLSRSCFFFQRAVWPFTSELPYHALPSGMSDISTWLKRINCQDRTFTC